MKWIYIERTDTLKERLPCGYYLFRTRNGRCYTMRIFTSKSGDKVGIGDKFWHEIPFMSVTHYCEIIQPTTINNKDNKCTENTYT